MSNRNWHSEVCGRTCAEFYNINRSKYNEASPQGASRFSKEVKMIFLRVFIMLGKSMVLLLITLNDLLSFAFFGKIVTSYSFVHSTYSY